MSKATSRAVVLLLVLCSFAASKANKQFQEINLLDVDTSSTRLAETSNKTTSSSSSYATRVIKPRVSTTLSTTRDKIKSEKTLLDRHAKAAAKAGIEQLNKMASEYLEQGSSEMQSLAHLLGTQGRHDEAASLAALAKNLVNAEKNVNKGHASGNHSQDKLQLIQIRNSTAKALTKGVAYTIIGEIRKSKCTTLGVCINHGDPLICKMVVWFRPEKEKSKRFSLAAYTVSPDTDTSANKDTTIGPSGKNGFSSNNDRLIKQISNSMDDMDDRWRQIARENGVDPDHPDEPDPLQNNKDLVGYMGNLVAGSKVKVPSKHATSPPKGQAVQSKSAPSPTRTIASATKISLSKEKDTQTWLWAEVLGLCLGVTVVALAIVGTIYYLHRRDVRTHANHDDADILDDDEVSHLNQPEQDDDVEGHDHPDVGVVVDAVHDTSHTPQMPAG